MPEHSMKNKEFPLGLKSTCISFVVQNYTCVDIFITTIYYKFLAQGQIVNQCLYLEVL